MVLVEVEVSEEEEVQPEENRQMESFDSNGDDAEGNKHLVSFSQDRKKNIFLLFIE